MRRFFCLLALVACTGRQAPEPARGLTVHEWGTFTSMQGSDGFNLEGLQHEEEGLPSFVYSRTKVRDCPLRRLGYKGLEVDVTHVSKKMETPVTYFYSDQPLRARVRVCFNHGLLTQWFPVTDLLGPAEAQPGDGPLDMTTVSKSFLEWNIDVLPKGQGHQDLPEVSDSDPWRFARIPNSNCLRTVEREAPRRGPVETEKFLFYRGLGRASIPLTAQTARGAQLTLSNGFDEPVRHLFVVHVRDGRGEFKYVPEIPARGSIAVACPLSSQAVSPMVAALQAELIRALVREGLFEDEARAMALTWERSYFHTEGLRVLYVVPERETNRILPIAIDPAPAILKRVLVGRLECITPEVEAEVIAALGDPSSRASQERFARLGRFLEPHLRRVLAISRDENVCRNARKLLESPQ